VNEDVGNELMASGCKFFQKPKLLDLFCGAGGAGEGYRRAGFDVTGVDIKPQKNNPHTFIRSDALEYCAAHGGEYDAIHASPPCQGHSDLKHMWNAKKHDDLIGPTRELLKELGKPYIIENVEGAPLVCPIILCGTMFGLGSGDAELRRHRLFEINWGWLMPPSCCHGRKPRVIGVYGGHGRDRRRKTNGQDFPTTARREAMGIDWMTGSELSQAIPPAYTEYLGRQLLTELNHNNRDWPAMRTKQQ
jgi:DNA (cytosine-5)-methyltransferase 1